MFVVAKWCGFGFDVLDTDKIKQTIELVLRRNRKGFRLSCKLLVL